MTSLAESIPTLESLILKAKNTFQKEYGSSNEGIVCGVAPGRVNLIGEHTDYNDGFVLPMALPLVTVVLGRKTDENGRFSIVTTSKECDLPHKVEESLNSLKPGMPKWANYFRGVVANFHGKVPSFEAVIVTSVPLGGGVSSSASLEVATYTFLEALTGSNASSKVSKALACQKAEHDFAGMPCGIMDQFVSTMAKSGCALKLDCRSSDTENVPVDTSGDNDDGVAFFITNSNVKHELTGSEYPTRRRQCEASAKILGVKSLREATLEDVVKAEKKGLFKGEDETFRRARHVVSEIIRTDKASKCLKEKDFNAFGKFMVESHNSLRDDFEVSCKELDELVEIALGVDGVLGSRMTGGGFGGCTVTLAKSKCIPKALEAIKSKYKGTPTFYICGEPREGARVINV